jgi:hypothetical protein
MDEASRAQGTDTTGFKSRLYERMRGMHREWLKNAQEIRQLELDYGAKLMTARTSLEAASFCNEWMAKRLAIVAHEQKMFKNSWLWLLAEMVGSPSAATARVTERG